MIYNVICFRCAAKKSIFYTYICTSLVAQMVKCLPTMRETQVQSLDREDPLEKEMAAHSSILAWKNPWTEEHGRLQSMGSQSQTPLSDITFMYIYIYIYFMGSKEIKPINPKGNQS